ncbi:autotransporter-associated beta strand repeat-containing protein [Stenotrophomonas sp. SORGH_AS_0282]|uniref:autotransporter-associated beta strand repeat-containing protein n=1 Tax=Stenotrophomonas sp. SORGH_AS_0282 TaxID=3041763 RepID=UPI0027872508|nr:autotransporter-associated beta strand repeat-containing protein [Stenotrophomonas sp. SORGH_AS_0282]MDQ1064249.1 fibronectin-binding autotransporter adhesin [Stenotrophomonas sp. SORGH_AS_0282]MDQ1191118.1 fibronectin-binding autotransporter adhesin [Stenotrophomonas sp. SORGH_AS_0282]
MNKVFKVVWSKAVGQWVVTSEFGTAAAGRTRRTANRLTTGPLAALSLMTALALYGPSAMAAVDITNIGFETGTLSGWTYSKTGTQGSTSYGTTGVGAAVVTGMTDFEADNGTHSWTVTPFGNNMASLQAGAGSDSFTTAATALGLDAASRALVASTMAGSPTNASWLYQDLTLAAGDYFSMAWQYVSTDYEPFNDASLTSLVNLGDASVFATVNNQNAQYALLGATNLGTGSYSTGSYGATGWQVATYQVSTAGTYRLGFMSLNLQDTQLSPVLFVDQAPGLTFDKGVPFGPVAPNPGSGAPTTPTTPTTPTGPIVIDGPKGTDELGNEDEASFEGGTLVVDKDTNVDVDFKIDDKPGTIDQNGHESTFTGKIDDATNGVPGSLIVKNSGSGGSVTLTNNNGYTGTTEVDENATLALSGNGSIDKSKKLVIDGTLDVTQAAPVVNIISLDGKGDVALGNNTLSITDANDEFEGTIGGQGDVAIKGGTQVLSGNNTYAGGTSVSNNAVLQVSSDENLGDAAGKLTLGGGTLHTTGDVNSARDVVLAGNGTFDTDTNTTLTNSGDVSGNGGLIKNGEGGLELTGTVSHSGGTTVNEGELTLSGQNTYTGGTTLNGGVLNVSSDGNLGDAAGGLTFNGGTLHTTGDVNSDRDVVLAGDGTFNTDADTTLTNSGDVSGNGGLIKNGEGGMELTGTVSHSGGTTVNEGELTLSGQNTYTGGTTLNGGVLNVSSDGNLGDATGGLTFNGGTLHTTGDVNSDRDVVLAGDGTFTTDTNTTLTNSGDVSGMGGLIKNGEGGLELTGTVSHSGGTTVNEGELTLSGQNTYTGGTTLNGGVLNVSSDGNLGDASGGLTFNGGTLQASSSMTTSRSMVLDSVGALRSSEGSTLTVNGPISGGGTLVADGQGTLVLGAANTHAGGTLISGGTVVLAHAGGLGSGAVAINDATLRTTVDTQVAQPLLVMGEATLDVASGTTTQLTGMLDGSRSTGCFIKSGAGRLNMAGTAVLANGTCVNEGTLSANGVLLSNVQVEREGTVRGTGTIAGNMRVDGTLAPGNSPGTLAVTGTVALTDDATLQIDIDGYGTGAGAGNYSRLLVSGAAGRFVANGTLQPLLRGISGNAGNTFTPKVGDMFRIVSGEGGVTGTFDRILQPTEGLAARTRFQVYYTTGFDIDLYVTPTAYSADLVGKVNGNGLATAAALDALVEASDAGTTTAEQTDLLRAVWQQDAVALPVLVTALTGESHAKLAALAQSNATALADDVTGRLGQGVLLDASSTRIDQLLWANIGYGDLSVDADASADRFDARQRRATAGIDVYRSSNVAWGAGLGRTTSELERSPLDNTLDSNAFFAYGAARAGAVVLDGMLSYSADRWESQRPDALGADGPLSGKASGTTRMASAGVSLPFTAAGLSWQPSLRGNWQKVERNAYREAGDSLAALDVARLQAEGSRATLGLSVGSLLNDPLAARGTWQFGLQAGINHGQARQATVTTALAGERVDLSAAEAGKAFGRAQLQGTVRLGASSYLYGGVSTEQGSGVENNSVNAGIRIAL